MLGDLPTGTQARRNSSSHQMVPAATQVRRASEEPQGVHAKPLTISNSNDRSVQSVKYYAPSLMGHGNGGCSRGYIPRIVGACDSDRVDAAGSAAASFGAEIHKQAMWAELPIWRRVAVTSSVDRLVAGNVRD